MEIRAERREVDGGRHRHRRLRGAVARVVLAIVVVVSTVGGVLGSAASHASACDSLLVPTVDIDRCVVPGHQAEIDAGQVVRVDSLSTEAGHWLAGHRTSHGGTFRALPGLQRGDELTYRGVEYRVLEYRVVGFDQPGDVLDWTHSFGPTVVLQTSRDASHAHLWRAEMISPTDPTSTSTSTSTPPRTVPSPPAFERVVRAPTVVGIRTVAPKVAASDAARGGSITAHPE